MQDQNQGDRGNKKDVTIIVNGVGKVVEKDGLSYDEVVRLAFDNPLTGPDILITITYRRGHDDKPDGFLIPGGTVKVKDGMIFDVTATDKS